MFNINKKTFLQQILSTELASFHGNNISENIKTNSEDDFKNGHILFKIPIKKSFMDDMLTTYRNPVLNDLVDNDSTGNNFHDSRVTNGLFNNVTDQLINIPAQKNYSECLDIIMDYKNALKENFYGAILRTKSKKLTLNPFHILTALSVLNDKKYQDKLYDIIIYSYKDREQLNEYTKNEASDHELVNQNIDALMNAYVSRVPTETRTVRDNDEFADKTSDRITVSVQTKKFADEDPDCSHYLSGHQLLTRGILAPFYGVSLIKMNGATTGLRLTPFGSCNISSDYGKQIPTSSPSYGSVCTGNLPKTTLKGLRSLSHANLGSPYGGGYIQIGALTYADIMIERCISLYESAKFMTIGKNVPLDFPIPEIKPLYSDAELECETLMQYFKLARITSSLPSTSTECKDRYNEMVKWRTEKLQAIDNSLELNYVEINRENDQSEDNIVDIATDTETINPLVEQPRIETMVSDTVTLPTYEHLPDINDSLEGNSVLIVNEGTEGSIYRIENGQWIYNSAESMAFRTRESQATIQRIEMEGL